MELKVFIEKLKAINPKYDIPMGMTVNQLLLLVNLAETSSIVKNKENK